MTKKNQKGFSLVELLVVVAIIGILAAVGVVTYNGYISGARLSAAKATHNSVVSYAIAESAKCSINQEETFAQGAQCKTLTDGKLLAEELTKYINQNYDNAYSSADKTPSSVHPADPGQTCAAVVEDGDENIQAVGRVLLQFAGTGADDENTGDSFHVLTCIGPEDETSKSQEIQLY